MEQATYIADLLRKYDGATEYDETAKKLLSERVILAWIMKTCVEEYTDCSIEDIAEKYIAGPVEISKIPVMPDETNAPEQPSQIESIGLEDKTKTEGSITYDIRFRAVLPDTDERVYIIIDVEAQGDFYPGYPLLTRILYYCCRMISSQNGPVFQHSEYEKIQKVYSIVICTAPKKAYENTITRYSIQEENLVGMVKEPRVHYDLLTAVMVCLGQPDGERQNGLLKMLHVLLTNDMAHTEKKEILENEFGLKMTETLNQEVQDMCDLGSSLVNKSWEKGRSDTLTEVLRNMTKKLGVSLEQAMTTLDLPEAERPKYRELLEQQ